MRSAGGGPRIGVAAVAAGAGATAVEADAEGGPEGGAARAGAGAECSFPRSATRNHELVLIKDITVKGLFFRHL
jgi:hypothetical protein